MRYFFQAGLAIVLLVSFLSITTNNNDNSGTAIIALATAATTSENSNLPAATFTLGGILQPAANNAVDGDINDLQAPFQSNSTPELPQPIPNPVSLGGYANMPTTGPPGRLRDGGDQADWYRVTMTANQGAMLYIAADGLRNDLDLGLFDVNGNLIDASLGQGRFEAVAVNRPGIYLLLVQPFQGASNYVLTVGQQITSPVKDLQRLSDPFVPGEVIVGFSDDPSDAKDLKAQAQATGLSLKAGGDMGRNALLALPPNQRMKSYKSLGVASAVNAWRRWQMADPLRRKLETLLTIKGLKQRPDVIHAAPNFIRQPMLLPDDRRFPLQWHYPLLVLPQAWDLTSGAGVTVAVLDTGVWLNHPDLQGQLQPGYDFISDPANAGDGDGIDADPNDPGDAALFGTSSFHGTHISGTIAAATNNTLGVAGVAFGAQVIPLRVLGNRGGTDYDIEQAVRYAAALPNDSNITPPQPADVINLSLGGPGFSEASQSVYRAARNAGTIIVAAAGNGATATPFYPASYDGVISVGAVAIDKTLAPYSNTGPTLDVTAPGGNTARDTNGDGNPDGILSTAVSDANGIITPGFQFFQGTSMAAGHMSGVAALMRAVNPMLTPQELDNFLANGSITEDLGPVGRDNRFGHGLINGYRAVIAASNAAGTPVNPVPILAVNPAALNFGSVRTNLLLTVANGGFGPLIVNSPTENSGGWLTLTPQVDANGIGNYRITVNRNGLAEGVYTATIVFSSSVTTTEIPVTLQVVSNATGPSTVGQQYVLLIDASTLQTLREVPAMRRQDGSYSYRFDGVPVGTYRIVAGTDTDNDGRICETTEACGGYVTLDNLVNISVNVNRNDLNFVTGFSANLPNPLEINTNVGYPRRPAGGK
jgi:serine protease